MAIFSFKHRLELSFVIWSIVSKDFLMINDKSLMKFVEISFIAYKPFDSEALSEIL